jgi:hypothetical protein
MVFSFSPRTEALCCVHEMHGFGYHFFANVEWWHRRDQAPIQLGTLSPVATHDLIGTLLLDR